MADFYNSTNPGRQEEPLNSQVAEIDQKLEQSREEVVTGINAEIQDDDSSKWF